MRKLLLILALMLAGCTMSQWNEKLSTPEDRALALKTIASLRSGNIDALKTQMEPRLFAQTLAMKDKIPSVFPAKGEPKLVTVSVSTLALSGKTISTKALNYEVGFDGKWDFVQVVLKQSGNETQIVGWHVTPTAAEPAAQGDFSFSGKGVINYVWIFAMLASTLTIVTALILAIRSRGIRYRWLWIVGSIVGLGRFSLNWSTGVWGVQPVSFSLFGCAFKRASPFDAWVLSFALPIVAISFLVLRSKLVTANEPDEADFR